MHRLDKYKLVNFSGRYIILTIEMQDRSLKEKWITSVCSFYMSNLSFDAVLKQLASNLPAYIMVKEKKSNLL